MRVEIQVKKLEISSHDEIPDIKAVRNVRIDLNHTPQPPELYSPTSIRGRHRISIGYYEEDNGRRREIGVVDCSMVTLLSDEKEQIHRVYDIWSNKGYNDLPLDVRVSIENGISMGVLPLIGVVAEKARLPPPIPPLALSPRPGQRLSI